MAEESTWKTIDAMLEAHKFPPLGPSTSAQGENSWKSKIEGLIDTVASLLLHKYENKGLTRRRRAHRNKLISELITGNPELMPHLKKDLLEHTHTFFVLQVNARKNELRERHKQQADVKCLAQPRKNDAGDPSASKQSQAAVVGNGAARTAAHDCHSGDNGTNHDPPIEEFVAKVKAGLNEKQTAQLRNGESTSSQLNRDDLTVIPPKNEQPLRKQCGTKRKRINEPEETRETLADVHEKLQRAVQKAKKYKSRATVAIGERDDANSKADAMNVDLAKTRQELDNARQFVARNDKELLVLREFAAAHRSEHEQFVKDMNARLSKATEARRVKEDALRKLKEQAEADLKRAMTEEMSLFMFEGDKPEKIGEDPW